MGAMHSLFKKSAILILLGALPMLAQAAPANTPQAPSGKAAKKALPASTEAGPAVMPPQEPVAIAPVTPEQLPAEPPDVMYENGQLTIDSQNSTLTAVLNAICRQIGAELDIPPGAGNERVAVHFSGSVRQAISALLDGSSLNYVIMAPPENPDSVQKVILTNVLPASGSAGQAPAAVANGPAPAPFVALRQTAQDKPSPVIQNYGPDPWCRLTPDLDECRYGREEVPQQMPPEQASVDANGLAIAQQLSQQLQAAADANGSALAPSVAPPQSAQDKPSPANQNYGPDPWCKLNPSLDECRYGREH